MYPEEQDFQIFKDSVFFYRIKKMLPQKEVLKTLVTGFEPAHLLSKDLPPRDTIHSHTS